MGESATHGSGWFFVRQIQTFFTFRMTLVVCLNIRDYDMILILILKFDCFRSEGFYVAYTAAEKPFALGNWTGESYKQRSPNNSSPTKVPIVTDKNSTDQDILKQLIPKVKLQ